MSPTPDVPLFGSVEALELTSEQFANILKTLSEIIPEKTYSDFNIIGVLSMLLGGASGVLADRFLGKSIENVMAIFVAELLILIAGWAVMEEPAVMVFAVTAVIGTIASLVDRIQK